MDIKEIKKRYREKNKEKIKKYRKEYNGRETTKEHSKRHYQKNKYKFRIRQLKYYYNLTIEEYNRLFDNQNGSCAICGLSVKLFVDHDHKTGKIRGLLCKDCNFGIGFLKDNIDNLYKSIEYLRK